MAFKPEDLKSEISKTNGYALASDFKVRIVPPESMIQLGLHTNLEFRIDGIDMPARSVTEINYPLYGAPQKIGATLNYVPITLTVIMSSDFRERDFFLAWQDLIGGPHRRAEENSSIDDVQSQFNLGFYKDYISDAGVTIEQLDRTTQEVLYSVTLRECYPSLVGASTMSWQTPEVVKLSVTMSYRYFTDKHDQTSRTNIKREDSLFTRLNKSGAGGLINMGVGRLAEKAGPKATAAAIFAAGKLMK